MLSRETQSRLANKEVATASLMIKIYVRYKWEMSLAQHLQSVCGLADTSVTRSDLQCAIMNPENLRNCVLWFNLRFCSHLHREERVSLKESQYHWIHIWHNKQFPSSHMTYHMIKRLYIRMIVFYSHNPSGILDLYSSLNRIKPLILFLRSTFWTISSLFNYLSLYHYFHSEPPFPCKTE